MAALTEQDNISSATSDLFDSGDDAARDEGSSGGYALGSINEPLPMTLPPERKGCDLELLLPPATNGVALGLCGAASILTEIEQSLHLPTKGLATVCTMLAPLTWLLYTARMLIYQRETREDLRVPSRYRGRPTLFTQAPAPNPSAPPRVSPTPCLHVTA